MNAHLINEITYTLLYYLREKEILKVRLEVSPLSTRDKELILKRLTYYSTKIVTIKEYLKEVDNKFKYCKN